MYLQHDMGLAQNARTASVAPTSPHEEPVINGTGGHISLHHSNTMITGEEESRLLGCVFT